MNANISVFVISVEAIIYLLLHNLQDCTLKNTSGGLILNVGHSPNGFHNASVLKVFEKLNNHSIEDFKLTPSTTGVVRYKV